uniref:Uncharacterized protein n=1 Tax=Lygus hesperus TaxID=30085 RepID=A0A146M924_LYGHE
MSLRILTDLHRKSLEYRCRKRGKYDKCVAVFKGSFFSKHQYQWHYKKILVLTYYFSHNITNYDFLIHETSDPSVTTSTAAIADWISYCREVCEAWAENQTLEQLGGIGTVVEIDESKVGKRKYHRGRVVEGKWVFGLIERGSSRFSLRALP